MARTSKKVIETDFELDEEPRLRPKLTPESREAYLVALAYDLVERRLKEGTATSQETTHFLKLGSTKDQLEKKIMEKQKELLEAKTEALRAQQDMQRMYEEAISAFKSYRSDAASEEEIYD